MYLFTISYGSCAVDQRSGDGWISGWSPIFVLCKRYSNAEFLKHSMQILLQHWTKSPTILTCRRRVSLEEQKGSKRGPFLSWKTDCLLDLRVLLGYWSQWFCRKLHRPVHYCSSKWWYSGTRFEMGRNSFNNDENPIWWHLGRIVQIKNTRVWETQDRIGIVQYGDSSEEHRTWLTQIEDDGAKKYWARNFGTRNGNLERNALVKNQGTKHRGQRTIGDCWQWKTNEGDNCSFLHDINKRAKTTQPNPSPSSSARQNERNASRTRSPRGKSPSGRMFRLPCKEHLKGTCTTSFCEKWHPPECLFYKIRELSQIWGKVLVCTSSGWRTA